MPRKPKPKAPPSPTDDQAISQAKDTAIAKTIQRNPNGTFQKGSNGYVGLAGNRLLDLGRARRQLNLSTIRELQRAFDEGGRQAIRKVMRQSPAMFLKMLVLLVPREMQIEHTGGVKAMSDEQLEAAIETLERMVSARASGDLAKVVEGTAEDVSAT